MSNFLAEAQVLIRPDTSKFRAELLAQLAVATRALPPIPVQAQVVTTGIGGTGAVAASSAALAASQAAVSQSVAQTTGALAQEEKQAKHTGAALAGLASSTGRLDAALLGLRTAVGSTAVIGLGAGALAAIALGKALRSASDLAADFETQMNVLAATTGASSDEINQAAEASRQLGEDVSLPAVSAGDAAEAITELSKAGLDLQESISGARGVLELATAANIDNAAATELAANALNAFRLAGDQATHVADLLANASIAAQGSIEDVGIALQQSAAAGAQVGVSLDDTVALLTLLARGGLRASDAGTSLRVALLRLAAPTNAARAILEELNIQVRDLEGNIRPEVFAEFAQAAAQLSPELRDAAAAAVFGQDAFRAFSLIGRAGAQGLAEVRAELDRSGAASDLAAARTKGFAGSLNVLQSEAETLGATLGQLLNSALIPLIATLATITGTANRAADSIRDLGDISIPVIGRLGDVAGQAAGGLASLFASFVAFPFRQISLPFVAAADAIDAVRTSSSELQSQLDELEPRLRQALATGSAEAKDLQAQVDALKVKLGQVPQAKLPDPFFDPDPFEVATFRQRFDEIGDAATRSFRAIGQNAGEALKEGLDQKIKDAIDSAKENLLSIGADLASQIGQLIDAGPLGQQLKRLQNALAARQASRQRLGLVDDLEDAQRQLKLAQLEAGPLAQQLEKLQAQLDRLRRADATAGAAATLRRAQLELREARESISGVGALNATERRALGEFLDPFIENVRSAKSALQQQNLEGRIAKLNQTLDKRRELFTEDEVATAKRRVRDIQQAIRDFDDQAVIANLQKVIAAQKKTVADGIANILTQFNQGKITLAQANAAIARTLASTGIPNYRAAGQALGAAFRAGFVANLEGLRKQLQELVGFVAQTPSGGAAPSVISPQAALTEFQKQTADNTKATADAIEKLPERIAAAIRRQQTPPTKSPTGTGVR